MQVSESHAAGPPIIKIERLGDDVVLSVSRFDQASNGESAVTKPTEADESITGRVLEDDDYVYDRHFEEGPKALQDVYQCFRNEGSVVTIDKGTLPTDVVTFADHDWRVERFKFSEDQATVLELSQAMLMRSTNFHPEAKPSGSTD
ncbi:MAG: hypothetical protein LQ346_006971 [Caloplaca aetnensis]|nr:MAG: hypothetical protein LQ346_006971 [Caloplaca aetnensis]